MRYLILLCFLLVSFFVAAQNNGEPYTFSEFCPTSIANKYPPQLYHTGLDADSLLSDNDTDSTFANRFAVSFDVAINPDSMGMWDSLPNGDRIWRYAIAAEGAKGLILTFDTFHLLPDAEIYLYDPAKEMILGAFDGEHNPVNGRIAISFPNDTVIIELYEPSDAGVSSVLNLFKVGYVFKTSETNSDENDCYRDVACPEGNGWEQQTRSVVKMNIPNQSFNWKYCSGTLINNTCNDGAPLILTAFHNLDSDAPSDCYLSVSDIIMLDYCEVIFNYQRPNCNPTTPVEPASNVLVGVSLVAECAVTDMALLKTLSPLTSNLNVYFSGWDRYESVEPDGGVCINHADGLPKKILVEEDDVGTSNAAVCDLDGVDWWHATWDNSGRSTGGSSGAPLYDITSNKIIGILSSSTYDCPINPPGVALVSFFGKLSTAFEECGFSSYLSPNSASTYCNGLEWEDIDDDCEGSGPNGGNQGPDPGCGSPYYWPTCTFSGYNKTIKGKIYYNRNKDYRSVDYIKTDKDWLGQGVKVKHNSDIGYYVYGYIELNDGFEVEEGGIFEAQTQLCCLSWEIPRLLGEFEDEPQYEHSHNTLSVVRESNFQIVPNPNNGTFTASWSGTDMQSIAVYNLLGSQVYSSEKFNNSSIDIVISQPGTYIVRAQSKEGITKSERVVVY